jgi:non-canonical poly(A) RNA polymerase PAPD5/7
MEIKDFYDHVKPCDYEERLRSKLVDDLNDFIYKNTNWRDWQMYPFGSFMSGLYLPTGDMDLAFCSRAFVNGGLPRPPSESQLRALVKVFRKSPLAVNKHIEPVLKARVPLIKYVDNVTGLKIDISFENNSGLIAVNTFKKWREQWPVMPVLVTIIKQYLLMRGLNEPVNGGIGGFSVICMVVSMLQMMPAVQSGDMVPEHDLGALLIHFFDLYGNRHNYEMTALRLNPPGYVNKVCLAVLRYLHRIKLTIPSPRNNRTE